MCMFENYNLLLKAHRQWEILLRVCGPVIAPRKLAAALAEGKSKADPINVGDILELFGLIKQRQLSASELGTLRNRATLESERWVKTLLADLAQLGRMMARKRGSGHTGSLDACQARLRRKRGRDPLVNAPAWQILVDGFTPHFDAGKERLIPNATETYPGPPRHDRPLASLFSNADCFTRALLNAVTHNFGDWKNTVVYKRKTSRVKCRDTRASDLINTLFIDFLSVLIQRGRRWHAEHIKKGYTSWLASAAYEIRALASRIARAMKGLPQAEPMSALRLTFTQPVEKSDVRRVFEHAANSQGHSGGKVTFVIPKTAAKSKNQTLASVWEARVRDDRAAEVTSKILQELQSPSSTSDARLRQLLSLLEKAESVVKHKNNGVIRRPKLVQESALAKEESPIASPSERNGDHVPAIDCQDQFDYVLQNAKLNANERTVFEWIWTRPEDGKLDEFVQRHGQSLTVAYWQEQLEEARQKAQLVYRQLEKNTQRQETDGSDDAND